MYQMIKDASSMVGFEVTFISNNLQILKENMNVKCKEVIAKNFNMDK